MIVDWFRLSGFRCFLDTGVVRLGRITVLMGANNSGKSAIIRGLSSLQSGVSFGASDVRIGCQSAKIEVALSGVRGVQEWAVGTERATCKVTTELVLRENGGVQASMSLDRDGTRTVGGNYRLRDVEPYNFIVPFLSRRKPTAFSEDVRQSTSLKVSLDMTNLAAKLSRVSNPAFPAYGRYSATSMEILGFVVTAVPSENGQKPGVFLPNQEAIPIQEMGEGVASVAQFLAHLAVSTGKLFLVEEPENDLHPRALRALLDLVLESSDRNQFVVSTHSNIVVRHLCQSSEQLLYNVRVESGPLPTSSSVELIEADPVARTQVLRELGYDFTDFGLWDGYLFLEESSAETLIGKYLIPMFVPSLSKVRTISAAGVDNVEPQLADFHRLVTFVHLEPVYRMRACVLVDGDIKGRELVDKLRAKFPSWDENSFRCLSQPNFEEYYPEVFRHQVREALAVPTASARRDRKRKLLLEVVSWLDADKPRARDALMKSAADVIRELEHYASRLSVALVQAG